MRTPLRRIVAALTAVVLVTATTACAPSEKSAAPDAQSSTSTTAAQTSSAAQTTPAAAFPRTVSVGDTEVTVKHKPERIVALSPDLTVIALELVGKDKLVMASELSPEHGNLYEQAKSVKEQAKPGQPLDPERVIGLKPDLVLVSFRHRNERDAAKLLENQGIPLAVFPTDQWGSIDDMVSHITQIGKLTGADDKAAQITDHITAARAKVDREGKKAKAGKPAPKVMAVLARGPMKMVMPNNAMVNGMVKEVGGTLAADELGIHRMTPLDPEMIVKANPDVLLVQNYRGRGKAAYATLLQSPALAGVPAVKNHRIYYVDPATTGVSAGSRVAEGLEQVKQMVWDGKQPA